MHNRYFNRFAIESFFRNLSYKFSYNKSKFFAFSVAFLLLIGSLIIFYQSSPTGRVTFDVGGSYNLGDILDGNLRLSLKNGEFIPSDTVISLKNGEQVIAIPISSLTSQQPTFGNYYVEGSSFSGSGQGYGTPGSVEQYPEVDFEFIVSSLDVPVDNSSQSGESSGSTGNDNTNNSEQNTSSPNVPNTPENNETVSVPEQNNNSSGSETEQPTEITPEQPVETSPEQSTSTEITPEQPVETSPEQSTSTETTSSSDSASPSDNSDNGQSVANENANDNANVGGSSITGSVISEDSFVVVGSVSNGDEFNYNLEEGQTVSIVSGSVKVNGETISDNYIDWTISNGVVKFTTDYSESETGFGANYLEDKFTTLEVSLSDFNLNISSQILDLQLSFENQTFLQLSHQLNINGLEPIETNVSTNVTILPINLTTNLSQSQQIPTIRFIVNSSLAIDLNDYFSGAERYSVVLSNNSQIFFILNNSILNFSAPDNFVGGTKATVYAYQFDQTITSNEFNVLVTSNAELISAATSTFRSMIIVGEPVKWIKTFDSDNVTENQVEVPAEAINYSIKRLEQVPELEFVNEVVGNIPVKSDEEPVKETFSDLEFNTITGNIIAEIDTNKESGFKRFFKNLFSRFTGNVISEDNVSEIVTITDQNISDYVLEYYTVAPNKSERSSDFVRGKIVSIYGPSELNYTDVIAFTNIDFNYSNDKPLKVYWRARTKNVTILDEVKSVGEVPVVSELISNETEENKDEFIFAPELVYSNDTNSVFDQPRGFYLKEMPYDSYSLNSNSVDYIEWVVPHLSNQTFVITDRTQITDCFSSYCLHYINRDGNSLAAIDSNGNMDLYGVVIENHSVNLWPNSGAFGFKIGPNPEDSVGYIDYATGNFRIKGNLFENDSSACEASSSNRFYVNISNCVGALDDMGNLRLKGSLNINALTY